MTDSYNKFIGKKQITHFGLDTVLDFGKHKGEALRDVDPGYIIWMVDTLKDRTFDDEVYELAQEHERHYEIAQEHEYCDERDYPW